MYLLNLSFGHEQRYQTCMETKEFVKTSSVEDTQEKWKNILETLTGDEK